VKDLRVPVEIDPQELLQKAVDTFNGSQRLGQQQMVATIVEGLIAGGHRIIQAGTGTGKSLGYLVPAAAHALSEGGGTVVVSTATIALQRQLMEKELPLLADTLAKEYGVSLTYAVLKGRNNYVCLQKLHSEIPDPDGEALFEVSRGALGDQAVAVRTWATNTDTGDRDDFGDDIDPRVWRAFSVNRRECVGESKCAFGEDCFTAKRRLQAQAAHIVVTNHALLALDVVEGIPILPEHDLVIIDEGHEIVDRATGAITIEINAAGVERAISRVGSQVSDQTTDLLVDSQRTFEDALLAASDPVSGLTRLTFLVPELLLALILIRDASHAGVTEMAPQKGEDPDIAARNQRARGGLEELHDLAGALISQGNDSVLWIDHDGRPPTLHSAPLSVAHLLRDKLFAEKFAVVTSATLTTGGNFEAITQSLGLGADKRTETIDVGSPFDYAKQGILYVAADLPPPGREGLDMASLDAMGELVEAAGGRTLILCSSWRAVEKAAEYLRVRCDAPLHIQRKGESVSLLVDRFTVDIESTLIGTLSLWQGVDVPGDSCLQVIIDRIPFPRPDDPLMSARSVRIDEAGGSGFRSVTMPRAGLLLAQAAGRLIRSGEDKGVVSVLDSRLANAGYGSSLRKSMPPMWFTTDRAKAISALVRLRGESDDRLLATK
jgi:ATP-dependent DNA helicase DinG